MLKKSLLASSVLVACVVAWVGAQERPAPSILSKPIQSTAPRRLPVPSESPQDLSNALKAAQQQATSDYGVPSPSNSPDLRLPTSVQPTAFVQQSGRGEPEVPSVLSGRKPQSNPIPQPGPAVPTGARPVAIGQGNQLPAGTSPPLAPSSAAPLPTRGPFSTTASPAATLPQIETQAAPSPSDEGTRSARTIEFGNTPDRVRPISIGIRGPSLRVDAVGPGSISVGKAADYEVSVVNVGALAAENVLVAIDFPAAVALTEARPSNGEVEQTDGREMARVIWTVSQIAAGGEQRLALKLTPQASQPFDLNIEWTLMPMTKTAKIEVTQPKLDLAIEGPAEVLYGQQATFKFEVTNTGTGAAENVMVRLPAELGAEAKNLGTLASGQSRSFAIEIAAVEAGAVELAAIASADGGLEKEATTQFVVRRGKLEVAAAGPDFKYAGTVATYDLVVKNSGDAAAADVIAAAALPQGADYVDGVPGAEKVEGGIRWDIGKLNPGEQREYAIRCILNTPGATRFEAGARGAGELDGADQVATTVEAVAELTLVVEDPKGPKPVGEAVTYTLRIKNRGSKAATDVNLLSQFSEGIEPTKVVGSEAELVPGQVIFKPIPRINAGEEAVLQITAVASTEGNHVFAPN